MIAFKWYVTVISMAALLVGCLSSEKKKKIDKNSIPTGLTQDRNPSNTHQNASNAHARRKNHKEIAEDNEKEVVGTSLHQKQNGYSSEDVSTRESEEKQGSAVIHLPLLAKSLKSASFDFLLPLNNDDDNLIFSQIGARRYDGRNIVNFGVGQRHFFDSWMLGYNTFYDRQISGNQHQRLSVGLELWKDYLKFSSNSYHRISGWKPSAYLDRSVERVAKGFDLRLEAALSSYPQISGNLKYEQYFGSQVATTNSHERYDNPSAFTAGVSYTPFPLVSLGLDHSRWNNGKNDNKLNLSLNYKINVPLSKQLDSRMMPQFRTLSAQRLDLVDRNHNIVLEHKDKNIGDAIKLTLPAEFKGIEGERKQVYLSITSKYEIDHVKWFAEDFISRGGSITTNSPLDYQIQLPQFANQGINQFVIQATAYDKKGNSSTPSQMTIYTERYTPTQLETNIPQSLAVQENITKEEQLVDPIDNLNEEEDDDNDLKSDKYDNYYPSPAEEDEDHLYDTAYETDSDSNESLNNISLSDIDDDNPYTEESTTDTDYDSGCTDSENENIGSKPLLSSSFTEEDKNKLNDILKNISEEEKNNLADKLREVLENN
ncbi:inverse autotransporter beta domain-containing protein [Sodalis ligni]|uniref:Inverse autotransporter-like protein with beta domain n=1 Tax=Sodalis ligni TaxID=2697027 RepID=A0A4R1NHW6_9GAMM|nr:inverse autotransporter beta domain-containing protein [Sodalis ligni]TCL05441.1 inverse autotransporter-like protein with beta domain [Sodalis ligni]